MKYDKSKYKICNWKHPIMLHWLINPAIAINELILGQRTAKLMLIEKDSSKSLEENTKIPCPHCGTMHSSLKWSTKNNAFKNWFGLYCDNCGKVIPCLMNFASILILFLTSPIWMWYKDKWKKSWLNKQSERYNNLDLENTPSPYHGLGWIKQGINWGFFMFIFMTIFSPYISGESFTFEKVLTNFLIWIVGGLIFGYVMKLFNEKKQIEAGVE